MRIQEMRSGSTHLKMKGDESIAAESTDDDGPQAASEPVESPLDQPIWAVVSFEKVEASAMAYPQAEQLMAALDEQRVAGLCIVTDDAAERMAG